MSSSAQRKIIVEYWFRVLIGLDILVDDILKIALKFAKEYETFSNSSLRFEDDGRILCKTAYNGEECSTFGAVIAKPGHLYHWRIKVMEKKKDNHLNIGIIEANKFEYCLEVDDPWYITPYGYSYFAGDGFIYNETESNCYWPYGDAYGEDDIIDIWLDLRDNKNELSFEKNNKKYGKAADVDSFKNYKLAIAMYGDEKKIGLMSFEIV